MLPYGEQIHKWTLGCSVISEQIHKWTLGWSILIANWRISISNLSMQYLILKLTSQGGEENNGVWSQNSAT